MEIIKKVLTDAYILKPKLIKDNRGHFYESFNAKVIAQIALKNLNFIQDNQSSSSKGVLRGLHFQKGNAAQTKLVRVVRGSAYDVAVDLRPNSPTFKQWFGVMLSETNHLQYLIPRGFAHAFVALEENTIFHYKVDNYYSPKHDSGIKWSDEELDIKWPKMDFIISEKDKNLPKLNQLNFKNLW